MQMRLTTYIALGFAFTLTLASLSCTPDQAAQVNSRLASLENATTRPAAAATIISQTTGSQVAASIAAALAGIVLIERTLRTYIVPAFTKAKANDDPNALSGTSVSPSILATTAIPPPNIFVPNIKPVT